MARYMSNLEMAILKKFQDKVHATDPKIRTEMDPQKRTYFRKERMQYRDELRDGHSELVLIRRGKLRDLLVSEVTKDMQIMRELGYDYIPTQP